MGEIICSNCGAKIRIPEHSQFVTGLTFSKDSKGTHYLPTEENSTMTKTNGAATVNYNELVNNSNKKNKENKTMTNAQARFETLKATGADMSKYFIFDDKLMKSNGNTLEIVEDDPIFNSIIEDGYVRNTQLHRRWVLAQMWEMLNYRNQWARESGYDAALRGRSYGYQWDMMLEEIRVLSKLEERDAETFEQRKHFFNNDVVMNCCLDYADKLKDYAKNLKKKKCKGIPYVRIAGRDIFVSDIESKLIMPILSDAYKMESMYLTYKDLYFKLQSFIKKYVKKYKLPNNTKFCPEFVQAFKGAGAYYSLRNLIQFHDCTIYTKNNSYKGSDALKYIDSQLNLYRGDGWRYLAMLKKCIADNNWTPNWR